ncbi:MAG: thiamine pyrophosphate-binding protein [Bdellovibrionales bacterium GWB1_55_8]|nr:MAG: thiamine pyrophosphate-binding protein [Bdellovibrionales bacterium GWB1_55_8]
MSKNKDQNSEKFDRDSRDLTNFQTDVLQKYLTGKADAELPADAHSARSLLPPGTARGRSFASIASEFPAYDAQKCVACMECVVVCPDAAIHARVTPQAEMDQALSKVTDPAVRDFAQSRFSKTVKFWNTYEKQGKTPGQFSLWIDPDKCKGCGECVQVCGDHAALSMKLKSDEEMALTTKAVEFSHQHLPGTAEQYVNPRLLTDMFLQDEKWVYRGGAGSCMGCGEITSLKLAIGATTAKYGDNLAIVAATGCNSVFSSTYPYNIFNVPWTNSLFENAAPTGLGVRMRLNQQGKNDTKVWILGGDGAMADIGLQAVSRALATGEDINILVMDTQSYSNTGGQASTSTFTGQSAKMSAHGKASLGKTERRKELGVIAMMHPDVFVAQVSPAYPNHFLRTVLDALEYPGPSLIVAYSPCMPEHGIADDAGAERAKAAVISRAFPLYVHDPRKGNTIKERLDLRGNPSIGEEWHKDPKTGEVFDFVWFARKEGRFAQHFKGGKVSESLLKSQEDRQKNWNLIRELAGLK